MSSRAEARSQKSGVGRHSRAGGNPFRRSPYRVLFGYWKELSPSLSMDRAETEAEARHLYASAKLGRDIGSWKDLTRTELRELAYHMRQDLGRNRLDGHASPDSLEIIAKLAIELWGGNWHELLPDRLARRPYFHHGPVETISPAEAHSLIEELLEYVARRDLRDSGAVAADAKVPGELLAEKREELRGRFNR